VLIVEDPPLDAELARGELTKTFGAITSEVVETAEAFASALRRVVGVGRHHRGPQSPASASRPKA
jgi:hypothetical protein